jgi:NifU-like protein involved in Fe-S cluster formation
MVESGYSSKAIELYVNNINVGKLENATVATTFLGSCGDLIKKCTHIARLILC